MFTYAPHDNTPSVGTEAPSYGFLTDRHVLMVDRSLTLRRAQELWEVLSAADTVIEDVLTALAAHGLASIPDFALVELVDAATGSLTVAVRGPGAVAVNQGQRSYRGVGAATWIEASVQHVEDLSVSLGAPHPAPARLPLRYGMVFAHEMSWGVPLTLGGGQGATADARQSGWVLRTMSGATRTLDGALVVGRAPKSPDAAEALTLVSPTNAISATHGTFRVVGDALLFSDLASTNGTILTRAEGSVTLLRDEHDVRLHHGDRLDFGDGETLTCVYLNRG